MSTSEEEMRGLLWRAIKASQRVDEFSENTAVRMALATDADGNYLTPSGEVPALFFNDSRDAAANIAAFIGQDLDPTLIEDYAAWLLRQEVPSTNGLFDLDALIAWQERYTGALTVLPGFHSKLQELVMATERVAKAKANREVALADFQRSPMQLFLDHDPATATRMLFAWPDTGDAMRDLLNSLAGNAEGIAGLRKAVTNHFQHTIGVDASNATEYSEFLSKNIVALTMLFEPEQMRTLKAIEADLHRSARSLQPPPEPTSTRDPLGPPS